PCLFPPSNWVLSARVTSLGETGIFSKPNSPVFATQLEILLPEFAPGPKFYRFASCISLLGEELRSRSVAAV
ncbi:MAG: hypothetical protein V3V75_00010, partial [Thermoguttaceae bacterium]